VDVSSSSRPAVSGSHINTSPAAISGKIAVNRTAAPHPKPFAATPSKTGESTCPIRPMPLFAQPRLDRSDVGGLAHLGLEELAHPCDLVTLQSGIGVGEEPMGRVASPGATFGGSSLPLGVRHDQSERDGATHSQFATSGRKVTTEEKS